MLKKSSHYQYQEVLLSRLFFHDEAVTGNMDTRNFVKLYGTKTKAVSFPSCIGFSGKSNMLYAAK